MLFLSAAHFFFSILDSVRHVLEAVGVGLS